MKLKNIWSVDGNQIAPLDMHYHHTALLIAHVIRGGNFWLVTKLLTVLLATLVKQIRSNL